MNTAKIISITQPLINKTNSTFTQYEANDIIEENSYDRHLSRENPSDKPLPIHAYNDAERLYMGAEF